MECQRCGKPIEKKFKIGQSEWKQCENCAKETIRKYNELLSDDLQIRLPKSKKGFQTACYDFLKIDPAIVLTKNISHTMEYIMGTISHEFMHYWIHREIGLVACYEMDNYCYGCYYKDRNDDLGNVWFTDPIMTGSVKA